MKIKYLLLSLIAVLAMGCNSDDNNEPAVINYGCFNGISVTTQAELDSVAQTIGPDCNAMEYLILGSPTDMVATDITSLASLSNIASIKYISIQNCPQLTSLEGLHNVREAGSVVIVRTAITNLNGFRSLKTFTDGYYNMASGITLYENNALTSLASLSNIESIQFIYIQKCPLITSLEGLHNVKESVAITVDGTGITDLSGLRSLESVSVADTDLESGVTLYNNNALVSLDGLQNIHNLPSLWVVGSSALESFHGLENCSQIDKLGIVSCPNLSSLANINIQISNSFRINTIGLITLKGIKMASSAVLVDIFNNPSLNSFEDAFENMTTLSSFNCYGNPSLASLEGLESLTTLQTLDINGNAILQSLNGLQSLTSLPNLYVRSNFALQSLHGIEGINNISSLYIIDNQSLTSIGALSNVTYIDNVSIINNSSLLTLDGLENITPGFYDVTIESNASLKNLCALLSILPGVHPSSSVSDNYNPVTLSTITSENCSIE